MQRATLPEMQQIQFFLHVRADPCILTSSLMTAKELWGLPSPCLQCQELYHAQPQRWPRQFQCFLKFDQTINLFWTLGGTTSVMTTRCCHRQGFKL